MDLGDRDWMADGNCHEAYPGGKNPVKIGRTEIDVHFTYGTEYEIEAKKLCADCVVRAPCLQYAISNRIEYGVWGGLSEHEREALRRRNRNKSKEKLPPIDMQPKELEAGA